MREGCGAILRGRVGLGWRDSESLGEAIDVVSLIRIMRGSLLLRCWVEGVGVEGGVDGS